MSLIPNPTFGQENPGFDLIGIHPNVIRGTEENKIILGTFQSQKTYNKILQDKSIEIVSEISFNTALTDAILGASHASETVLTATVDTIEETKAKLQAIGTSAQPADATVQAILSLNTAIEFFQAHNLDAAKLLDARDRLAGALGNAIDGTGSSDIIASGVGYDEVFGRAENDILFGNQGNDTIAGETGNDTIFGGKDNDLLLGGQGNDRISGELGNDVIFGELGNDTLLGDTGNDSLYGGQGNDFISGGQDNDFLLGNEGQDTFYFNSFLTIGETMPTVAENPLGLDSIGDFNPAEDRIAIDRRLFPAFDSDTLLVSDFAKINAIEDWTNPANRSATIVYDTSTGLVYYNPTDEMGDEVEIVKLQPNLNNLSADNFNSF